jgi:hypothetical protein
MSRADINALKSLIESAQAGRYTLPAELTQAYETVINTRQIQLTAPPTLEVNEAANRLAATVEAGGTPDLMALGREVHDATAARQAHQHAQQILNTAVEQVAERAALLAIDLNAAIITDHLRPALERVYDEARDAAGNLGGYSLDPHALLTAPAKVRNAYLRLPELAARRSAIIDARRLVNQIGRHVPQHDQSHLFGTFRNPMFFQPGWQPPMQIQPLPFPTQPVDVLLWIISDEVAAAEPWLPTVAQQDQAWLAQFGDAMNKRHAAHDHANALAGV